MISEGLVVGVGDGNGLYGDVNAATNDTCCFVVWARFCGLVNGVGASECVHTRIIAHGFFYALHICAANSMFDASGRNNLRDNKLCIFYSN